MPADKSYLELRTDAERLRFWAKVQKRTGCWEWTSATLKNNYGVFMLRGNTVYVHRVAFLDSHGEISSSLVIDHICRNRRCVNPDHLRELTRGENVRIGIPYGRTKTHCIAGHLLPQPNKAGRRVCIICHRASCKRYEAKKRGTAINDVLEML